MIDLDKLANDVRAAVPGVKVKTATGMPHFITWRLKRPGGELTVYRNDGSIFPTPLYTEMDRALLRAVIDAVEAQGEQG